MSNFSFADNFKIELDFLIMNIKDFRNKDAIIMCGNNFKWSREWDLNMTSPSAVVCREIFDENSQPSAEGIVCIPFKFYINERKILNSALNN